MEEKGKALLDRIFLPNILETTISSRSCCKRKRKLVHDLQKSAAGKQWTTTNFQYFQFLQCLLRELQYIRISHYLKETWLSLKSISISYDDDQLGNVTILIISSFKLDGKLQQSQDTGAIN